MPQPRTYGYTGAARIVAWDAVRDSDTFECSCGWRGTFDECATELFSELMDASCPRCDTMLVVRSFATHDETRQAAADGDPGAIAELNGLDRVKARWARAKQSQLTSSSPLPELTGEGIEFLWDFEEADDENWTIIRAGESVVWRELAFWEGQSRFIEVREILRERYGSAFGSLTPTTVSELYLYGDESPGYRVPAGLHWASRLSPRFAPRTTR